MRERERERETRDVGWVGGCKNWTGRNERWRGGTQRLKRLPVTSRLRDDANRVLSFSLVSLRTTSVPIDRLRSTDAVTRWPIARFKQQS